MWRDPFLAPWFLLLIHFIAVRSGYGEGHLLRSRTMERGRDKTFPTTEVETAEQI